MAKRPGIPAGVKRLFRKLSCADKVRKFRILTGRDAHDDEEMDEVFMALAADFWEMGINEWADDDSDVDEIDGIA
jgi:hypothetical protein